jgi:hypothetical protein
MSAKRMLQVIGLVALFLIGAVIGVAIGVVIFAVSLYRGARAVHAEGVVCRAEIVAGEASGARLAGPALVRLSGAFEGQTTAGSDVLGLAIRLQRAATRDPSDGDQDLLLATFESFRTAGRDRARTQIGDYLANGYSTVAPWWLPGNGPVILRLVPPPPGSAERGANRLARLDADLASGRARFSLAVDAAPHAPRVIAELRLVERLSIEDHRLRASMFRHGRGVRPIGLRNGIRATVYPMSQAARRLRGR